MVERLLPKQNVASSNLVSRSNFFACEFVLCVAPCPSGKGEVCKTFMHQFDSGRRLQCCHYQEKARPLVF